MPTLDHLVHRDGAARRAERISRSHRPEQLADAILFLGSDKASFVTGQIISVNGGRKAS
jgi:NAD(P)-dependent dehydrogenase (short-subunit alcohol dehydrogenase family)